MTTAQQLWRQGRERLTAIMDEEQAGQEARWLLEGAGAALWQQELEQPVCVKFEHYLAARLQRIPLAYVLGETQFMGLTLEVSPAVLIPRNDSECLVEQALHLLANRATAQIADLGTGSGALALAVAQANPAWQVDAVDISAAALAQARANGARLNLNQQVNWLEGDLFRPLCRTYDLIISNPPYVTAVEMQQLDPEVRSEPSLALTDGGDGLAFYRRLSAEAPNYLQQGGWLLVEIGYRQQADVYRLFSEAGFKELAWGVDGGGRVRWVCGRWF